ncbi:hypothetical protein N7476_004822 [Penicillium atrosanguineum]|uniref:Secreted protein CSS2 C-terminal domain-containing protein n=1 Tax=Penicillium atrosanguineum TaxID=1132637 RepID=A0A9W9U718_9EURO|nr:hypothetical protein N7526_001883 [Penicillium atrosanguineum]KAJ5318402.1 hypothetical protein N7476_004822 [Penicillium atrosanguineum]
MVNCRKIVATLLSLGFVSRGVARNVAPLNSTYAAYIPAVRDWDDGKGNITAHYVSVLPDSPLLTGDAQLATRDLGVSVQYTTILAGGNSIILAAAASVTICKAIATEINYRSTANQCSIVYGTSTDGKKIKGYSYRASTTGNNCKTTAIYDKILAAVEDCANDLHAQRAVTGCCKFRHGGSWTGHLRLSAEPEKEPVEDVVCNFTAD